jgi:hypothetical protein
MNSLITLLVLLLFKSSVNHLETASLWFLVLCLVVWLELLFTSPGNVLGVPTCEIMIMPTV